MPRCRESLNIGQRWVKCFPSQSSASSSEHFRFPLFVEPFSLMKISMRTLKIFPNWIKSFSKKHRNKKKNADEKSALITAADSSRDAQPAYEVKHSDVYGRWLTLSSNIYDCLIYPMHRRSQVFSSRSGLVDKRNYHSTATASNWANCERR